MKFTIKLETYVYVHGNQGEMKPFHTYSADFELSKDTLVMDGWQDAILDVAARAAVFDQMKLHVSAMADLVLVGEGKPDEKVEIERITFTPCKGRFTARELAKATSQLVIAAQGHILQRCSVDYR